MSKDNQGAIFIASFSEQLIREKVMMPMPDRFPLLNERFRNNGEWDKYNAHVASRRTFPLSCIKGTGRKGIERGC